MRCIFRKLNAIILKFPSNNILLILYWPTICNPIFFGLQ